MTHVEDVQLHIGDYVRRKPTQHASLAEIWEEFGPFSQSMRSEILKGFRKSSAQTRLAEEDGRQVIRYHPPYDVKNKEQLRNLLLDYHNSGTGGVILSQLYKSYPMEDDAKRDVDELEQAGDIIRIKTGHGVGKREVIYYRDKQFIERAKVSDEVRAAWQKVVRPAELEKAMVQAGLQPLLSYTPEKPREDPHGKKRKKRKRRAINAC
eukprot:m.12798 g.12798  ORF g.12798 m.12798 type:complete len:208 (-) comp5865_c0_seq2:232-855(-)